MRRALWVVALVVAACTPDGGEARVAGTPEPSARSQRRLDGGVVYENFCTRRPSPRTDLVAAFEGQRVVVTDGRKEVARIRGRPPVRWSASGTLLAVGPRGALWTWDGRRYEGPDVPLELASGRGSWAWSPSGDCALILEDGRLDAFHTGAGANTTTLIDKNVESAAWGPRGRIAVVLEGPELWIVDLKKAKMRLVSEFDRGTCCVVLGGWTRSGDVLFWAGPGMSAMQEGWPLQSVDEEGRTKTWDRTLPRPDTIAACKRAVVDSTATPPTGLLSPRC